VILEPGRHGPVASATRIIDALGPTDPVKRADYTGDPARRVGERDAECEVIGCAAHQPGEKQKHKSNEKAKERGSLPFCS
jgi:hypothetical protein